MIDIKQDDSNIKPLMISKNLHQKGRNLIHLFENGIQKMSMTTLIK